MLKRSMKKDDDGKEARRERERERENDSTLRISKITEKEEGSQGLRYLKGKREESLSSSSSHSCM